MEFEEKLNKMSSSSSPSGGLVGIESRILRVESLLCMGSLDVRVVGIWGMAGIGKTTIAEAVFKRNYAQFDAYHFLANVREESAKRGLLRLKQDLLHKLSCSGRDSAADHRTPLLGLGFAKQKLRRKRVLIVLDDANSSLQLQELFVGERHLFGPGSRIIVTSRDRQVLKSEADDIYEVDGLNLDEALELFCQYGWKQNYHPSKEFMQLSRRIVYFAKGNPLALKVLGSFLHDKSEQEWKNALEKLHRTASDEIKHVLRLSYDGLDVVDKDIFLDVACFFKGEDVNTVKRILGGCDSSVDVGINILIDKCLVTISNNKLWMHDLLQELGWEIVEQEFPEEPGKRSRLWNHQEIYNVLTENKGTQAVEGISLDMSEIEKLHLTPKSFKKMYNLRLLKFYNSNFEDVMKVHFPDEDFRFPSSKLRYLHWYRYPSKSLPSSFYPELLVELNLPRSNLEKLWEGEQRLAKLKQIDLSYSEYLNKIPDLSKAQNLETLNLRGCTSLVEVPSSVQDLSKLEHLNLEGCKNLTNLPGRISSKLLKKLNLYGCSHLQKCPDVAGNLEELNLNWTAIEEIPSSVEGLTELKSLNLSYCTRLARFPSNIWKLKHLQRLNFTGCSKLESFPEIFETMAGLKYLYFNNCKSLSSLPTSIGNLKSLTELDLKGTMIRELPPSIGDLSSLEELDMFRCKNLVSIPENICSLKSLKRFVAGGCTKLDRLPENLENLVSLEELDLSGTAIKQLPSSITHLSNLETLFFPDQVLSKIPGDLGRLSSLKQLALMGNHFDSIPESIEQLPRLVVLDVGYSKRLRSLPELPRSLEILHAHECISLETVLSSKHFCELGDTHERRNFKYFAFTNCFKLDQTICCNIASDAERRIRCVATSPQQDVHDMLSSVKLHFPGREIPRWFCYQSMGSSLTMLLPSNFCQIKRIAFCTVIEFEGQEVDYRGSILRCKCRFKAALGECSDIASDLDNRLEWYCKSIPFTSNHVFLWDDPCWELTAFNEGDGLVNYPEASFEFYPLDYEEKVVQSCKVTKCAIHLVYNESTASGSFSCDELEGEPHSKRLKFLHN